MNAKKRSTLLALAMLLACVTEPALAQSGQTTPNSSPVLTPAQQQALQTFRLYSEFFARVEAVDALGDQSEAVMPDPRHRASRLIQDDVKLSDATWQKVEIVVKDYLAQLHALQTQRKAALDAFKAANPGVTTYPKELRPGKERFQLTNDHVNQLQAALSPAEFQQLDTWVRTSMHKGGHQ